VVGVGDCGKAVVRRANAFGMRVLGNDVVSMPDEFLSQTRIQMVCLEELLAESNFVSLNPDLNPTSHHLIAEEQFHAIKPSAYLINTSRGPVVDESALIRALEDHRIAGAALDVFEEEPLPASSPLRTFDSCLLAPHNANSSPGAWKRVHNNTVRNLLEGLGVTT
jgi:D-3-phosphoglycerate dehydrogenase